MLNTTSAFITFYVKLEDEIITFYNNIARNGNYKDFRDYFLTLANENKKNKVMVLRTYREVVTDAFEGGFPLFPLDEDDFSINTDLSGVESLVFVLKKSKEIEEISQRFCKGVAESTLGLMADVPQAFQWVAKKKSLHIEKLIKIMSEI